MARYTDAVCRLCRRENMKLFLKGERCLSDKCAINKRNYAPGQHGQRRTKLSEYGLQLREKQKVKRTYGVLEFDNVVYLMGFADSRAQARQLVQHGHIRVNSRRVNIPSFLIKQGDVVEPREKSRDLDTVRRAVERLNQKQIPAWIHVDSESIRGVVQALPRRHDLTMPFHEQLIVELYSK